MLASGGEACWGGVVILLIRFELWGWIAIRSAFDSIEKDVQMSRYCFTAILMVLLASTCTRAEDYLLRLETSGFRDRPQQEQQLAPTILESIEIVARVNQPFYGNTTIDSAKISISGILEQLNDGRFRVQIRSRKSTTSGESVLGPNGLQLPITKSTNIDTSAIVELNKAAELGKDNGASVSKNGEELITKTRSVLFLQKFVPSRN